MSYVLHFWDFPVPHSLEEAERFCREAHAKVRPQNPLFLHLARELTTRYPCLSTFDDDDADAVWVDGPLDGITDRGRYSLGIATRHLEEVYPFVVETATSLGLVVYDFQSGETHLPCGMTVKGDAVLIGNHLGMPIAGALTPRLVERVLFDALSPILERLGFEHNRALGGLWRSFDEGHQSLCFSWLASTPEVVSFDIDLSISLNRLKKIIEPMLAGASFGQEKYVASAMSSLALFCLFSACAQDSPSTGKTRCASNYARWTSCAYWPSNCACWRCNTWPPCSRSSKASSRWPTIYIQHSMTLGALPVRVST